MGLIAILEDELIKGADDVPSLDAGGRVIKNSANPVDNEDLTNRKWVLDRIAELPNSIFDFEIPRDFPDLQTAMASSQVQAGATLLVTSHPAISSTILINKNDIRIIFKTGFQLDKGGNIDIGVDIQANGVIIEWMKLANFQQLDDVALRVGANARDVRILNCTFVDNYEHFQDLSDYTIEIGSAKTDINFTVPTVLTYDTPKTFIVDQPITPYSPTNVDATIAEYVATGLPSGLTINQFTGEISGTPTVVDGLVNYTVEAINPEGSVVANLEASVVIAPPTNLTYVTPQNYTAGQAIPSLLPQTIDGVGITFSSPNLLAGLSINSTTGEITGTPTNALPNGVSVEVVATNSTGNTNFFIEMIVADIPPSNLSYSSPQTYEVDTPITPLLPSTASGTNLIYSSQDLPDGLLIDANTGEISGTPVNAQSLTASTIRITNSEGFIEFDLLIEITDIVPSGLSYPSPNTWTATVAINPLVPTLATGSGVTYTAMNLPNGLAIDPNSGSITGTPQDLASNQTFTVTATNDEGSTNFIVTYTVLDEPPSNLEYFSPANVDVSGPIAPIAPFSVNGTNLVFAATNLPAGLSIDSATGEITGTPTEVVSGRVVNITATNVSGVDDFDLTINVDNVAPSGLIYNAETFVGLVNQSVANTPPENELVVFDVVGIIDTYSATNLPTGLSIDPTTGEITGTPTENFLPSSGPTVITATNSLGTDTTEIQFDIADVEPSNLTYDTPKVFELNVQITPFSPLTIGGTGVQFEFTGTPPAGLVIDQNTGEISGTPTALFTAQNVEVHAYNLEGDAYFNINMEVIDVAPANLTYDTPKTFNENVPITPFSPLTVTGTNLTYSAPNLPDGLVIDSSTGEISGTPTTLYSTNTVTVTITNPQGTDNFGIEMTVLS